jgi:hypothetical protein
VFSKDLLQMGVTIENANTLSKTYGEQIETIGKTLKQNAMRVSQIDSLSYSLSYLVASSMGGARVGEQGPQPLDIAVSINVDI